MDSSVQSVAPTTLPADFFESQQAIPASTPPATLPADFFTAQEATKPAEPSQAEKTPGIAARAWDIAKKTFTTPLAQALNDAMGKYGPNPGGRVASLQEHYDNVVKALSDSSFAKEFFPPAGGSTPGLRDVPGVDYLLSGMNALGHTVTGVGDFMTTPAGFASAAGGAIAPPNVQRVLSAGYMAANTPAAVEATAEAVKHPSPENVGSAVGALALAGAPEAIRALPKLARLPGESLENWNARAEKLVEQERSEGLTKEQPAENPTLFPVKVGKQTWQVETAPGFTGEPGQATPYVVRNAKGKVVFGGKGGDVATFLRQYGAEPANLPFSPPAAEGAPIAPPASIVEQAGRTAPAGTPETLPADFFQGAKPAEAPATLPSDFFSKEAAKPAAVEPGAEFELPTGKFTVEDVANGKVRGTKDSASGQTPFTLPLASFQKMVSKVATPEKPTEEVPPISTEPTPQPEVAPAPPETEVIHNTAPVKMEAAGAPEGTPNIADILGSATRKYQIGGQSMEDPDPRAQIILKSLTPEDQQEINSLMTGAKEPKILGSGFDHVVVDLGDGKVMRLGALPKHEAESPYIPTPELSKVVGNVGVQVYPKLDTENITDQDVVKVESDLANQGLGWDDPARDNLARDEQGNFKILDGQVKPLPQKPTEIPASQRASTQVNLPAEVADKTRDFASKIPDEALAEDGRETEPHVTLFFGLHDQDPEPVRRLLAEEGPIKVRIKTTSLFPASEKHPDFDVLKADVESADLDRLHAKIEKALPNTNDYPDYQPHLTIAYLKKGEGKKYAGKVIPGVSGKELTFNTVHFSPAEGEKVPISLKESAKPLTPAEKIAANEKRIAELTAKMKAKGKEAAAPKIDTTPFNTSIQKREQEISEKTDLVSQMIGSLRQAEPVNKPAYAERISAEIPRMRKLLLQTAGVESKHRLRSILQDAEIALEEAKKPVTPQVTQSGAKYVLPSFVRPARAGEPERPGTWMNGGDIEEAYEKYKDHPVLGKASKFLFDFMNEVNEHSDGWPYWKAPAHAALKLETLLQNPHTATEAKLSAALVPIRSFYTRLGTKAGLKLPDIKIEATSKKPAVGRSYTSDDALRAAGLTPSNTPIATEKPQAVSEIYRDLAANVADALRTAVRRERIEPGDRMRLLDSIVKYKGNNSEKHGISFGLYPKWAGDEADALVAKVRAAPQVPEKPKEVDVFGGKARGVPIVEQPVATVGERVNVSNPDGNEETGTVTDKTDDGFFKVAIDGGKERSIHPTRITPLAADAESPTIQAGASNAEPEPVRAATPRRGDREGALEENAPEDVRGPSSEREAGQRSPERSGEDEGRVRGSGREGVTAERGEGSDQGDVGVPASGERRTAPRREPAQRPRTGSDYRITAEDHLGEGTARTKAVDNINAIRTLKAIEAEGREANPEEQKILAKYVGWGGMPQAFMSEYSVPKDWQGVRADLEGLLTEEEFESARASTPNAHFTSEMVVNGMWDAAKRLGLLPEDGQVSVLEPAMGSGNFFGLMPEGTRAQRVGVELDSITGRIAKLLYPQADVHVTGFEKVRLPGDYFDLAIGNVPFGNYGIHDPKYKRTPGLTRSIHDYFFAKALDTVRPGGVVAFITSSYTMDKKDPYIRQYLASKADLLGAIRLPNTTFKGNAGTEVTTDIIFLQKRAQNAAPAGDSWTELAPFKGQEKRPDGSMASADMEINEYYAKHPDMMLGKMGLEGTMYAGKSAALTGDLAPEKLAEAIKKLPENVVEAWAAPQQAFENPLTIPSAGEVKDGAYTVRDGKILVRDGDQLRPADVSDEQSPRVRGMVGIRDAMHEVFRTQREGAPDAEITAAMKGLGKAYDAFVKKNGFLHERANVRAFSDDPDDQTLLALENWDPETKKATKSDIFTQRVIDSTKPATSADSAVDALGLSLNELGRVDWTRMQDLTGKTPKELQNELGDLVFQNPAGKTWEPADEYLSGNVRNKLEDAEAAARTDKSYQRNIEALKAVQPKDLLPGEIKARLGAAWIPKEDVKDFVATLLDVNPNAVSLGHSEMLGAWTLTLRNTDTVANKRTWGTKRVSGHELIDDALNMRNPTVYDVIGSGADKKTVVNEPETLAAREMQRQIKDRFQQWAWEDFDRAKRLADIYNHEHNSDRLWQPNGEHLTFPGMSVGLKLRKHQKNGVWRIVRGDGNVLLAHVVGSGKTLTIVGGAMELRRLGRSRKPLVVVPKNRVQGTATEWLRAYPSANVLVIGGEDFTPDIRERMMARIATGNWDGVIVSYESFEKLPVSDDTFNAYLREQISQLSDYIRESKADKSDAKIVKQLEKSKKRLEAKLRGKADREAKDTGIKFEDLGIDSLFVDEADSFKNLQFSTKMARISGIPNTESKRAFDMYIKSQYIAKRNGGRGLIFATGTPVANSMAEVWTMQRYLQPKYLRDHGLQHFDAWAQTFGEVNPALEMNPDGSGVRVTNKFNKFVNAPELIKGFRQMADVQTARMLKLPVPALKTGKPIIVSAKASPAQMDYLANLAKRAKAVKGKPPRKGADNILVIGTDGQKAALDMRLVSPGAPDHPGSKINLAVDNIHKIWRQSLKDRSTQLIFSDMGVPDKKDKSRFTVYAEIKRKLIAKGIPAGEIAFIQDYAKNDEAKENLFAAVNKGRIRILLGSTSAMGVGVNVQNKLLAEHHLDAPYRPRDVEQREGRMIRQGNTNPEVENYRYVTEPSFDARKWDILQNKASYINAFMEGDISVREIEDVSDAELSYGEIAAIASGNPAIREKVLVDTEIRKLDAMRSRHDQQQFAARSDVQGIPREIKSNDEMIAKARKDIATREANEPVFTIGKKTFKGDGARKDAAEALGNLLIDRQKKSTSKLGIDSFEIGKYRGFRLMGTDFQSTVDGGRSDADIRIIGELQYTSLNNYGGSPAESLGASMVSSIEGKVRNIESIVDHSENDNQRLEKKLADTKKMIGDKFDKEAELVKLIERQRELEKILQTTAADEAAAVGASSEEEPSEEGSEEIQPESARAAQPESELPPVVTSGDRIELAKSLRPGSAFKAPRITSIWDGNRAKPGKYLTDGSSAFLSDAVKDSKVKDALETSEVEDGARISDEPIDTLFQSGVDNAIKPLEELGYGRVEGKKIGKKSPVLDVIYFADTDNKVYPLDAGRVSLVRRALGDVQFFGQSPDKALLLKANDRPAGLLMPLRIESDKTPDAEEARKQMERNDRSGERGSAPMLTDLTQYLTNKFGDDGEAKANYSGLGALESRFIPGGNLAQLEKASKGAHTAAIRAASDRAQSMVILRQAIPQMKAALKGGDVSMPEVHLAMIESRLLGLRDRWRNFSQQAQDMTDEDLEKTYDEAFSGVLKAIAGKRNLPQDIEQTASALHQAKDWETLRSFLSDTFSDAATAVTTAMEPEWFDSVTADPHFRAALGVYKKLVEQPLAENHSINEGVFSDALGPLDTYYPLIPLNREQAQGPGRRLAYHKPKNIANAFATGMSEGYDPGVEALRDRIAAAVRSNDKAALLNALEAAGLLRKLGKNEGMPEAFEYRGEEYEPEKVEMSPGRMLIQGGKATPLPATFGVVPKWAAHELRPILERQPIQAPTVVDKFINALNTITLTGVAEPIFHASNLLGTLIANTPYLENSLGGKLMSAPFIKKFGAIYQIAKTNPSTAESAKDLIEMSKIGLVPDRYASMTFSKKVAEEMGSERRRLSLAPILFGPQGIDIRARLVMYRLAKGINPGATPQELYHFVNQLGNYVPALQSEMERAMKRTGFSPFITAGTTMLRNGLNAWTGGGPMPKKGMDLRIWQQFTGGALFMLAMWAYIYHQVTGKWPWRDRRAKMMAIPAPSKLRHSKLGQAMWGKGPETGYVNLGFFNPLIMRGARGMGIPGAFETQNLKGNFDQTFDAAVKDMLNAYAQPFLGPPIKAAFVGITGQEPYVTGMRDRQGHVGVQMFPVISKDAKPGFPQRMTKKAFQQSSAIQRGLAAAREINSFYGSGMEGIGQSTGLVGEDKGKKGNQWAHMLADFVTPGLVGNATNPFARETMLRQQRAAMKTGTR